MSSSTFAQFNEKDHPGLIEPQTQLEFEDIIIGPTFEKRKYYYRYVTYYNTESVSEYLDVPWVEELCHDDGDRFFNWNRSFNYRRSYEAGLSFSVLGIGVESGFQTSQSVTMGYQRWIHAEKGVKARHFLKKISQIKSGLIQKQIKYKKTGKTQFSTSSKFPKDFYLDNQSPGLVVERQILEICE